MRAFRGTPGIYRAGWDNTAELTVSGLNLNFGGVHALRNIDLQVHTGELVAIIGPNGAGKTSLLNCLTGFYRPGSGQIFFNGKDVTAMSPYRLTAEGIGRTFQNIELFPKLSVLSNLLLARHLKCNYPLLKAMFFSRSVREEEMLQRRLLEEIIDFLEIQSIRKSPVGALPYGMRKRVELGRAMCLEPKLLILDEPFAGMNLEEKEDMVRFLLELNEAWGQTIILVEHDMSIIMNICRHIVVLNYGEKLAEGNPEEIQNNREVISAYLGKG